MRFCFSRVAGFCFCALLLLEVPLARASGILVSPAQMGLVVKPGESATEVFRVSPSRAEKTQVRVRVVDFDKTPDGATVELKEGSPRRSCLEWVRVEPLSFETAESGWTEVRVNVTVPAEATGTSWALVVFQVDSGASKKVGGRTVSFRPQLQVPILVTARGTEARGARIENLKAVAMPDGFVEVSADMTNTGNTGLQPTGSWVLERKLQSSDQKEEIQEKEMASFLLLPGHSFHAHDRLPLSGAAQKGLSSHLYVVYGVETGQTAEATSPVESAPAPTPSGPPPSATSKGVPRKGGSPRT